MNLSQRTEAFLKLGRRIKDAISHECPVNPLFQAEHLFDQMQAGNPWFIPRFSRLALSGIAAMLEESAIRSWLETYPWLDTPISGKRPVTAIVMAGNIPAVGFHDFLCALISGHDVLIRLSSKDKVLPMAIGNWLISIEPGFADRIRFTEGFIKDVDFVIATGSNNSSRYFEHYFSHIPHIIRKNRFSLAVLDGLENENQLRLLGNDLFPYFGMGCRNVSRIMLPSGYDLAHLMHALDDWNVLGNHSKYHNNYEYNKAIALLNKEEFLDGNFFLMKPAPDEGAPPLSVIYYSYYANQKELLDQIQKLSSDIQCLIHDGRVPVPGIEIGGSQQPKPSDFADNIDTIQFLNAGHL